MTRGGWVVILLVARFLMASSLGWSLALGCRPAAVLRLLWYRFGLFFIACLLSSGESLLVCGSLCLQWTLWLCGIGPGYFLVLVIVLVDRGVEVLRLLVCVSVLWFLLGRALYAYLFFAWGECCCPHF